MSDSYYDKRFPVASWDPLDVGTSFVWGAAMSFFGVVKPLNAALGTIGGEASFNETMESSDRFPVSSNFPSFVAGVATGDLVFAKYVLGKAATVPGVLKIPAFLAASAVFAANNLAAFPSIAPAIGEWLDSGVTREDSQWQGVPYRMPPGGSTAVIVR